jgi:hypothetical protein
LRTVHLSTSTRACREPPIELLADAQPGDSLFFSFSGHGLQVPDTSGDGLTPPLSLSLLSLFHYLFIISLCCTGPVRGACSSTCAAIVRARRVSVWIGSYVSVRAQRRTDWTSRSARRIMPARVISSTTTSLRSSSLCVFLCLFFCDCVSPARTRHVCLCLRLSSVGRYVRVKWRHCSGDLCSLCRQAAASRL